MAVTVTTRLCLRPEFHKKLEQRAELGAPPFYKDALDLQAEFCSPSVPFTRKIPPRCRGPRQMGRKQGCQPLVVSFLGGGRGAGLGRGLEGSSPSPAPSRCHPAPKSQLLPQLPASHLASHTCAEHKLNPWTSLAHPHPRTSRPLSPFPAHQAGLST